MAARGRNKGERYETGDGGGSDGLFGTGQEMFHHSLAVSRWGTRDERRMDPACLPPFTEGHHLFLTWTVAIIMVEPDILRHVDSQDIHPKSCQNRPLQRLPGTYRTRNPKSCGGFSTNILQACTFWRNRVIAMPAVIYVSLPRTQLIHLTLTRAQTSVPSQSWCVVGGFEKD